MSAPSALELATGLLADAGLKSTAVLLGGWAVTQLLRRGSAAQRHAIWTTTLASLPLLPVLAFQRGPAIALDTAWLVPAWLAGALAASTPLLVSLLQLRRLRHRCTEDPSRPGLLHSELVNSPMTWGFLRPLIVLPSAAEHWEHEHRQAALAHERAHVARGDWLVHLGAWAVCVLFWFHPGVWWARRQLLLEAERAADDVVLASGIRPTTYATLLVRLARAKTPRAAMSGSSFVSPRVQAILGDAPRSARRWPAGLAGLLLIALTLPTLAGWAVWTEPPPETLTQVGCLPEAP